ncbi:MAG: hypothetical protein M3P08_12450 [Thermoproteota archaeon]|nr:hypothetical protein [Thermoproteota archaeon]
MWPEGNRVSLFEGVRESYIYNNNYNKNKTKGLGPESSASSGSSGSEPDFTSVKAEVDKLYDKEKQVA